MVQPDGITPLILFLVASLQPTILMVLRELQFLNMSVTDVKSFMFQPLKSKDVREVQPQNI